MFLKFFPYTTQLKYFDLDVLGFIFNTRCSRVQHLNRAVYQHFDVIYFNFISNEAHILVMKIFHH